MATTPKLISQSQTFLKIFRSAFGANLNMNLLVSFLYTWPIEYRDRGDT